MPSLDEIRRQKLEELMRLQMNASSRAFSQASQEKLQQQAEEHVQIQQQIELMENAVRQFLTKEALARYGNLKAAHKEKALQLLIVLFQAMQKGQIQSKLDDSALRKILERLTPKKREIKIKRV